MTSVWEVERHCSRALAYAQRWVLKPNLIHGTLYGGGHPNFLHEAIKAQRG